MLKRIPENAFLIEVQKIFVAPDRGRKDFSGVPELQTSIEEHGLIHPIVVTDYLHNQYTHKLVAGECRFRALLMMGEAEVPCSNFKDLDTQTQKEIELEENLKRKKLEWSEEIDLLKQLDDLKKSQVKGPIERGTGVGWTLEDTAAKVNQPAGTVRRKISLARKLEARPDLLEKFKDLPMQVAARQLEDTLKQERIQRLHKAGKVELSSSIRHGSALELIQSLPDESVDLVLTDPPFGVTTIDDMRDQKREGVLSYTAILKDSDNSTLSEVIALMKDLAPQVHRVLKPGGHFYMFFTFEFYPHLRIIFDQYLSLSWTPIVWNKMKNVTAFRGYEYMTCYEPIQFGFKAPRTRRLAKALNTILDHKIIPSKDKLHPFEKPQSLLRQLIEQSTSLGETVLDPFCGSGSTVVAAQALGRNGIGFELNEQSYISAQARLTGVDV